MRLRKLGIAAAWVLTAGPSVGLAATVGHWRMDEAGAANGGTIGTVVNVANPGTLNGAGVNGAKFGTDVPGAYIFDPVANTYTPNAFSLNASGANHRVNMANNPALNINNGGDKSFTIELFLKLTTEPASYDAFLARVSNGPIADTTTSSDRNGWQIDFDHAATAGAYGKIRSRWDLAGTPTQDLNRSASGGYVLVDNDAGTGLPAGYDNTTDVFLDGDGVNDLTNWHHLALTYNHSTRQFRMHTNGVAGAAQTLTGTYDHADIAMDFGKLGGSTFGLLIDEVRYSDGVLPASSFLSATSVPEPALGGFAAVGLLALVRRRRRAAAQ